MRNSIHRRSQSTIGDVATESDYALLDPSIYIRSLTLISVQVPGVMPKCDNVAVVTSSRVHITGGAPPGFRASILPRIGEYVRGGPLSGMNIVRQSKSNFHMGSWCRFESIEIYDVPESNPRGEMEIVHLCGRGGTVLDTDYFYVTRGDNKVYVEMLIDNDPDSVWRYMDEIHWMGYGPDRLRQFMGNDEIQRLGNLSSRAWDAPTPRDADYVYTLKVDGERAWMLLCGKMCYFVRRDASRSVAAWCTLPASSGEFSDICVLDVEMLAQGKPVLIDVLKTPDGTYAPSIRGLRWMCDSWNAVSGIAAELPVSVRRYFNTKDEAEAARAHVTYPTDGVMAVSVFGGDSLKLKSVKAIELECKSGELLTSDGFKVLDIPMDMREYDGKIMELRISHSASDGPKSLAIHGIIPRPDKKSGNKKEACVSIIGAALSRTRTPGDIQRRLALAWCNSLRSNIMKSAWNKEGTGRIILDLGSGGGQSLNDFEFASDASFIFVEPDADKCKALAKRCSVAKIYTIPDTVVPAVVPLQKGAMKYCVFNGKASDILGSDRLMKNLRTRIRCVTAVFSAHFCRADLLLCGRRNIPYVGCCYMYDGANSPGSILLNCAGVAMRVGDDGVGLVTWGGDKTYSEPVTVTSDFAGHRCTIKQGYGRIPQPGTDLDSDARTICSKVYVVSN